MATTFYRTGEGILARERDRRAPEVHHDDGKWRPYPELDPMHDARVIERPDAVKLLPKGKSATHLDAPGEADAPASMGDLESTGDTGNFGDIYEGARVPLRP